MEHYSELRGKGLTFLSTLWFLWFMNIGARSIFAPILPLIEDEFAIDHAQASSIFLFQSVGYAVSLFLSGLYAGRLGYKKCIVVSLAVSSAVLFLTPLAKTVTMLCVVSCIVGVSAGAYLPSALPLITGHFEERRWGKSIAIHDSAASFSILCTPFIALFLLRFSQWRGIFGILGVVFFVCAIAFFLVTDELKVPHAAISVRADLLKRPALWIMAALWVFASGANWGLYFTIPLYLTKELSLGIGYANTVLGISRLGGIAVAVLCGVLVDKFNLRRALFVLLLLTGLLTITAGIVSARFVGFSLFFQVIFVTGIFPLGLVSIARLFDAKTRGMATGIILTVSVVLGSGLIPYLLGLSGDLISFRFGFVCLGGLVTLSSLLLFYLKELDEGMSEGDPHGSGRRKFR